MKGWGQSLEPLGHCWYRQMRLESISSIQLNIVPGAQLHIPFVAHSIVFLYTHLILMSSHPVVNPAAPLTPFGCCQMPDQSMYASVVLNST
jgi:hypothetical protein